MLFFFYLNFILLKNILLVSRFKVDKFVIDQEIKIKHKVYKIRTKENKENSQQLINDSFGK